MSEKPLALYTDIVDTDPTPGIALLETAGYRVEVAHSADPDVIAELGKEAIALLIGYSPVTQELLDRLPKLQIVATQSVGVDMVDLQACADRQVTVTNVPAAATEEVATHALAFALALVRGLPEFDRATKKGEWNGAASTNLARPSTLTVGVLGLGRIGRSFADLARPIFGNIIGYDPADFETPGITRASLEEVLRSSDVLSLHLPLNEDTRYLLNRERLAMLPQGARVINVARGGLIDPEALADALDEGVVACAALDVFEVEPPASNDRLLLHERVLATPHAAYLSPHSALDYVTQQAEEVVAWLREGRALHPVV